MSVLLKGLSGPDSRKVFDFDQVFGGSEGNTQEDVFKDTKHLCMSVVDGYNVCIFAYGQTGAGKVSCRFNLRWDCLTSISVVNHVPLIDVYNRIIILGDVCSPSR